jgi:uncharacterized protein
MKGIAASSTPRDESCRLNLSPKILKQSRPKGKIVTMNRIVHFEIPANQPEVLTKFYGGLFGWKFQRAPLPGPEYWMCDTGSDGPGINGAIMQRQDPKQPWMNYVDVASIDAALEQAAKLGATVALPKTPIGDLGAVAALIDPDGNICGLWERKK